MEPKELNQILKDRGIKQTWVASKLKVSKGLVNQWVKGVNPIPEKYKIELKTLFKKSN